MMMMGWITCTVGGFMLAQFMYGFQEVLYGSIAIMVGLGLVFGAFPAYLAEIFPTRARAIGGAWNLTTGSLAQLATFPIMAFVGANMGWGIAYQLFVTASALACFLLLFFLPKPAPKADLEKLIG